MPTKIPQIDIFGLKQYHLATLQGSEEQICRTREQQNISFCCDRIVQNCNICAIVS
jgi:hypothetical protein